MSLSMTRKQSELLEYLRAYIAEHDGIAPSFEEMKDALELKSKSGVHRLVTALEERGLVRKMPNRARALEVVPQRPPASLEAYTTRQLVAELARRGESARVSS